MRSLNLGLLAAIFTICLGPAAHAQDWVLILRQMGLDVSPQSYLTLHQFETQGNTERQVIQVNLIELAKTYPKQAQAWIDGASEILEKTYAVSTKHESFKRTRTSFLQAVMAVLWAEGSQPKTLNADHMVNIFQKYYRSPKKFYEATAIFYAYSNLVNKGLVLPGPKALREAAVQFRIASYKNKMDIAEISLEEENRLRNPSRRIASFSP